MYARLHLVGDAPEVPKRQAPLTNNAQIRVAPGRVDTQLKSRPSLELASSVSRQVGMTSAKQVGIPRSAKLGPIGHTIPLAHVNLF